MLMNKVISRAPIIGFALLAGLIFIGYGIAKYIWNPEIRDRSELERSLSDHNYPDWKLLEFSPYRDMGNRRTYLVEISVQRNGIEQREKYTFIVDKRGFFDGSVSMVPRYD